jgi:outer membrane cobalamin receptor
VSWIFIVLLATATPPRIQQEIVVTAERSAVPQNELTTATTVITRKDVEALPASNAAEVLALVPGLTMFGGSSSIPATPAMRGFYGAGENDYARLLVDGAPLADAESNVAPWQQLHANDIERIEVVRGLASPVYGDAAFGGIVQIFTRTRAPGEWTAMLTGGSDATVEGSAGAWTRIASGDLSILGDWRQTGGDRPHSASTQGGARLRWRRDVANALLTLSASARTHDRDDPGPLPLGRLGERDSDALFASDRDDHDRRQLAGSFDAKRWRASVHVTSKSGDATRTILVLPPLFADTASRSLDSGEAGASLQVHGASWHGGIDLARQHFDATWSDGAPLARTDTHRNLAAAHATARVQLRPRMTIVAGARYDHLDAGLSRGQRAFSPRAGVAMQSVDGATSVYAAASHGFTAPTLEQLYDSRPLRLFGDSFTLANPDLEPQRARGVDAGIAHQTRFGSVTLDAYFLRVRDEIDFDASTFRYANLARSEHRGLELLLQPRHAYVPRVTYAWTRVTNGDTRAQLKNIPRHSATVMLPLHGVVTLLYAWNSGRFFDDAEQVAAPDTHALSLRAQKQFGRTRVFVDVLNATDSRNAAVGYALPDLNGGLSPYAYPDQRRTVRVSVSVH